MAANTPAVVVAAEMEASARPQRKVMTVMYMVLLPLSDQRPMMTVITVPTMK